MLISFILQFHPLRHVTGFPRSHHICTYNLLVWKWIDEKFDIKWMYLLCFVFVDTPFLLCRADILGNAVALQQGVESKDATTN